MAPYNAGGSKTDWFLPSRNELNMLMQNRAKVGIGDGIYHWSSSQFSADNACTQSSSGTPISTAKTPSTMSAHPIRAF